MNEIEEHRKKKQGIQTPKSLLGSVMENIEDIETIAYAVRMKDGRVLAGWSEMKSVEALGLLETGKYIVLEDMRI